MSSLVSLTESLLQKIGDIPNIVLRLGNNYKTKSLIDVTQVARVEPLTVISRDLIHLEYMNDILQSTLSIFAGYYLQAIALSTKIDDVRVVRILDRLNPDRHFNDLMITSESMDKPKITSNMIGHFKELVNLSIESYKFRLPTSTNKHALESEVNRLSNTVYLSQEAKKEQGEVFGKIKAGEFHKWLKKTKGAEITDADIEKGLKSDDKHVRKMAQFAKNAKKFKKKGVAKEEAFGVDVFDKMHGTVDLDANRLLDEYETSADSANTDKEGISAVNEMVNLSVGKLVNVTITINKEKAIIPVNMRLAATSLALNSILHILALKKEDNTLTERFHAWRAGRIGLIKDLIFCQDLIDEHKRALMNDESGVYGEIIKRVNNSKKFGILANNPSLVSASNIFVISEEVAADLERQMGGRLNNARVRTRVFENTYAMLIVVVDREWERVTFYHRGISQATEVSIKEIKGASKSSKGGDIQDFMKSLMQGSAPTF